ncbi:MAG: hypothetical protein WC679_00960 [Bacteroidales bacterium]|jgi:hypothetical protein
MNKVLSYLAKKRFNYVDTSFLFAMGSAVAVRDYLWVGIFFVTGLILSSIVNIFSQEK